MTYMEAMLWNTGTHQKMLREQPKVVTPQGLSTEALGGGGLLRSSDEVAVMAMERRGQLIRRICIVQLIKF
jgi:hypothetical protein